MSGLFLKCDDPEVVQVVESNKQGIRDLFDESLEWARERGFDTANYANFGDSVYIVGLPGKPTGFGQWTALKRGSSHPYKTNEAEYAILRRLAFKKKRVPGLPEAVHSVHDADGASYLMYPTPFVADGAAWVSYSHQIEAKNASKIGDQWRECLASVYYAAKGE